MIVRALDGLGDWTFGKGKNNYLVNNAAIVQLISTRLNSYLGNCFFDLGGGLDWFNLLGSKNQLALELAVRAMILNTEGVVSIINLSIDFEENVRQINMTFTVSTVYSAANATAPITSTSNFLLTEAGDVITTEDGSGIETG